MNKVLLDYDGFIARAFYAGYDPEYPDDYSGCFDKLKEMEKDAENKAIDFFNSDEVYEIHRIVSGHSFKKDFYPTYKAQRKNDEALGDFRDIIKRQNNVVIADYLEADDYIILSNECARDCSIVFSDDKDLHKYCKWTCKLGHDDQISKDRFSKEAQLIQMITGDSCDNIKGVPQFGEAKAKKYLDSVGYNLDAVIRLYKTREISLEECVKNFVLVHPVARGVLDTIRDINFMYKPMELVYIVTHEIAERVKKIYNEED